MKTKEILFSTSQSEQKNEKDSEEYADYCCSFTTVTLGVSHTEFTKQFDKLFGSFIALGKVALPWLSQGLQ